MTVATPHETSGGALLRYGSSIHIRAIWPDDKERLRAHFHRQEFVGVARYVRAGDQQAGSAEFRPGSH